MSTGNTNTVQSSHWQKITHKGKKDKAGRGYGMKDHHPKLHGHKELGGGSHGMKHGSC